jgi:hypothetical protein
MSTTMGNAGWMILSVCIYWVLLTVTKAAIDDISAYTQIYRQIWQNLESRKQRSVNSLPNKKQVPRKASKRTLGSAFVNYEFRDRTKSRIGNTRDANSIFVSELVLAPEIEDK